MIVTIPSNRPQKMRSCLLNVLEANEREKAAKAVVIVDDSGNKEKNWPGAAQVASQFSTPVHYFENNYSPKWLFENYGGIRNACLGQALVFKDDVLMLDDDVFPLQDCLSLHKKMLEKHAIVQGGVHGQQTGVGFFLKSIQRALEAFENGEDKQKVIPIIRNAFCGVSMEDYCAKYSASNLSISLEAVRKHCFLPTPMRFEDGLYCNTAKYFTGEEVFCPSEPPLAYHKPSLRDVGFFYRAWKDSVNGSAAGLAIDYFLSHHSTPEKAVEEGPKKFLEQFGGEWFKERRSSQKKFDELIKQFGDAEIEREYFRIVNYNEKPTVEFLIGQIELFNETRLAWERFHPT